LGVLGDMALPLGHVGLSCSKDRAQRYAMSSSFSASCRLRSAI
jgi:hypothetical protein